MARCKFFHFNHIAVQGNQYIHIQNIAGIEFLAACFLKDGVDCPLVILVQLREAVDIIVMEQRDILVQMQGNQFAA